MDALIQICDTALEPLNLTSANITQDIVKTLVDVSIEYS